MSLSPSKKRYSIFYRKESEGVFIIPFIPGYRLPFRIHKEYDYFAVNNDEGSVTIRPKDK